jgi:hypothetical protein
MIACATLAPGAEKVLVTTTPADVAGCKVLGQVATPDRPITTKADMENKLRNAAFAIGANAVFKTAGTVWSLGYTDMPSWLALWRKDFTVQGLVDLFKVSGETEFFLRAADAQISFVRDSSGAVSGLVLHQGGQDLPAKKLE